MEAAPALVVVASAWDEDARTFVVRHEHAGVALLAPRDLSRAGWHFRLDDPAGAAMVAGGRCFRLGEVHGVLTRLAGVTEADLAHIHTEDQAFVAAELTAFLLALLTRTNVPVVNRPTPQCLCGPAWSDARWRKVASALGFPVPLAQWRAALGGEGGEEEQAGSSIAVVADACFGTEDNRLASGCRALAKHVGAELLTVEFAGPTQSPVFLRARPHVDLSDAGIETAVLRRLGVMI